MIFIDAVAEPIPEARSHSGDPTDTVIARLIQRGCDPRPTGPDQWESRCPSHEGDKRNLSIARGDDGRVLLYCHRSGDGPECDHEAIAGALGLTAADLFPPSNGKANGKPRKPANGKAKAGPKRSYETVEQAALVIGKASGSTPGIPWYYADAGGDRVMAVVRFDKADGKDYRPFHKGGDGRWRAGDPEGPLPLYNLPALAPAESVIVVEGEKAADAVAGLGLVVTTSAHGSKAARKSDWSPLAGKRVAILPDNDQPGEGYARDVMLELGKLAPMPTVRVVRLPGLPDGGDAVEWLESLPDTWGPDEARDQLARLIDAAPAEALVGAEPGAGGPRPAWVDAADDVLAKRPQTDLGNAERLVARHGRDLRYCHPWSKWLVWDGRRWKLDNTAAVRRRAKDAVRKILAEAATVEDDERRKALVKWGFSSENRGRIDAMLSLASAEAGIPILPDDMDPDPWLFNCLNGTIDLRTGTLRAHDRDDRISMVCPLDFDPSARCPLWEDTLRLFFGDDQELIGFWQRVCGYTMVGVVRDHVMPIAYGSGSNGKSTILGAILDTFGPDYAMKCPPDMLMAKKTDSHPTDRADLFKKRLVVAIETEANRRLNETMVKELTGGDRIRARRMREDFWEFSPTHTLLMATNHKPVIRGSDNGIWRRLRLIPFTVSVTGKKADKAMPDKLRAEFPGILAWCVRGCLAWQSEGLKEPESVTEATEGYRQEQDLIGAFLDQEAIRTPGAKVQAAELYRRYQRWAESGNEFVMTQTMFGREMEERGIQKKKSGGNWYIGIGLRPEDGGRDGVAF